MTYNRKFLHGHFPAAAVPLWSQQSHLEWQASFYNQGRFLSLRDLYLHQKVSDGGWHPSGAEWKHLNRHIPWPGGKLAWSSLRQTTTDEVRNKRIKCWLPRFCSFGSRVFVRKARRTCELTLSCSLLPITPPSFTVLLALTLPLPKHRTPSCWAGPLPWHPSLASPPTNTKN